VRFLDRDRGSRSSVTTPKPRRLPEIELASTVASPLRRHAVVSVTAALAGADVVGLAWLGIHLGSGGVRGWPLLLAAACVHVTNVLVFGLWFWELDGGGPPHRLSQRDFAFPQALDPALGPPDWRPRFVDYLYLSFTNASAFSAADTLPLTAKAKLLMLVQSAISIVTLVLVAARAVDML
jgi:uncharacterized membrane protein